MFSASWINPWVNSFCYDTKCCRHSITGQVGHTPLFTFEMLFGHTASGMQLSSDMQISH